MIKSEIVVPLLNANEPEAHLVDIHVRDGQPVKKGDLLFTIETTKAASEINSPETGFIRLIAFADATVLVGEKLAYIIESPDEQIQELSQQESSTINTEKIRITKPARTLANSLGLDISNLPTDRLITEAWVRQLAVEHKQPDLDLPKSELPGLLFFGAGGHAKSVIELAKQLGAYSIVGIVDDNPLLVGKRVLGIPVLGSRTLLSDIKNHGVNLAANGVGGIIDINIRVKIFAALEEAGFLFPALIHPRATIETSAICKDGAQVFANAYIGSEAVLNEKCMVNTNAVISHDCTIGPYSHVAPGALLAGHVNVGSKSLVGMGVTTAIGVNIGDEVRIGNGAIILADVPNRTIIQAGRFWTGKTS